MFALLAAIFSGIGVFLAMAMLVGTWPLGGVIRVGRRNP